MASTYLPDLCAQVESTEKKKENNHKFVLEWCFCYLGKTNALEHNWTPLSICFFVCMLACLSVLANILSEFVSCKRIPFIDTAIMTSNLACLMCWCSFSFFFFLFLLFHFNICTMHKDCTATMINMFYRLLFAMHTSKPNIRFVYVTRVHYACIYGAPRTILSWLLLSRVYISCFVLFAWIISDFLMQVFFHSVFCKGTHTEAHL